MRASEFVLEKIASNTTDADFRDKRIINNGKWILTAEGGNNTLHLQVLDNDTKEELAWTNLSVRKRPEDNEKYLVASFIRVNPKHRGKGLAKIMYQYANELGNDILPSTNQTDDGKGMWKGLEKHIRQPAPLPKKPEVKPTFMNRFKKLVGVPA